MIISDKNIILKYFDHTIDSLDEGSFLKHFDKNYQEWSYDLCLGKEAYITCNETPTLLSETEPYVTIRPGEFALLITYERLKLKNDVMAFISIKMTYKKKGLINISGFHVDPTYEGRLIFSVYNAGPSDIVLRYKDPVFMIFFQEIKPVEVGGHNNVKPKIGYDQIPVSIVSEIKGQSTTLADNRQKIEKLEQLIKIYGGIAIAIITTLLGVLIAK